MIVFSKQFLKCLSLCTRHTAIQTSQYKIIHRILACNEWLKNIKIKSVNTCSFCNNVDSISHFLIDCRSNNIFVESWTIWWESRIGLSIQEENHIHESILFGFPGNSDDAIVMNYCIQHAKHYIYVEKFKNDNNKSGFNVDVLGYLCHFKHTLKIKTNICTKKNQTAKFGKFNVIFENL